MSLNILAFMHKEGKERFHTTVSISSLGKEQSNALIILENMKRM